MANQESKTGSPVSFKYGSAEKYEALKNNNQVDSNSIYFIHDSNGNKRIYVGTDCYNIGIVEDLETGTISSDVVPSTEAVVTQLNKKASQCNIIVNTATTITAPITLVNNTEYRYFNLTDIDEITVNIDYDASQPTKMFYSTLTLYSTLSGVAVGDFVTVPNGASPIRFLNPEVELNNTVELMFFSNGRDICCIAGTYEYTVPQQEVGE